MRLRASPIPITSTTRPASSPVHTSINSRNPLPGLSMSLSSPWAALGPLVLWIALTEPLDGRLSPTPQTLVARAFLAACRLDYRQQRAACIADRHARSLLARLTPLVAGVLHVLLGALVPCAGLVEGPSEARLVLAQDGQRRLQDSVICAGLPHRNLGAIADRPIGVLYPLGRQHERLPVPVGGHHVLALRRGDQFARLRGRHDQLEGPPVQTAVEVVPVP